MFEKIEEIYDNTIKYDIFLNYYFFIVIVGVITVSLFLSFWYYILVYFLAFIMLYLTILKNLNIKIFNIKSLNVFRNLKNFKKHKKNIRVDEIRRLLAEKSCLNKSDIHYLIKYYKSKTIRNYNIDWFYSIISFVAPIVFGYFNHDMKNNEYVTYQLLSILTLLALFYGFYVIFRKVFSKKVQKFSMYRDVENILYELYFEVKKN
jgi:hypothetical protein